MLGYIEHRLQHRASFLVLVLCFIGAVTTLIITIVESGLGTTSDGTFLKRAWDNLTYFVDPGRLTEITNPAELELIFIIKLIMTVLGILVFSTLIAVIAQLVEERISRIRSGISPVRSERHTIFIGFSEKIALILNDSLEEKIDRDYVIYSDQDDDRMRLVLSDALSRGQKILFKKGRNQRIDHAQYLNLTDAKNVLILKENTPYTSHDSDIVNLQIMVSLITSKEWKKNKCNIVVEVEDEILFSETMVFLSECKDLEQANLPCRFSWNSTRSDIISATAEYPAAFDFFQNLFGFKGDDFHFISHSEMKTIAPKILEMGANFISSHLKKSVLVAIALDSTDVSPTMAQEACIFPLGGSDLTLTQGFSFVFISKDRKTLTDDLISISREKSDQSKAILDLGGVINKKEQEPIRSIAVLVNHANAETILDLLAQMLVTHSTVHRLNIYFFNASLYDELHTDIAHRVKNKIESLYEYCKLRLGANFERTHLSSGLLAMPVISKENNNCALFYILSRDDSLLPSVLEKIPVGAFLIGFHAVRSMKAIPKKIEWDELNKLSGCLLTASQSPFSDNHQLIALNFKRAVALADEDEGISVVAVWADGIGGDITFSEISTEGKRNKTNPQTRLVDFNKLKIETHFVNGLQDILSEVSLCDQDIVLWLNDEPSEREGGVSIDPLSERLHWLLRNPMAFDNRNLFDDPVDFLMDALEEKGNTGYHSALLCVANANTARRINQFNLGRHIPVDRDQADIGAFDSDSLISSIMSSLMIDQRYAKLLAGLRTGELAPVFLDYFCQQDTSVRALMVSLGKSNTAVPIAFRNKDSLSVRFRSISENLDTLVNGEIVFLCMGVADKRTLLAPSYTF